MIAAAMDLVTVKIPRIDHSGIDFPRLPGMVIKVSEQKENIETYKSISLKEAAQLQSARTGSLVAVKTICNCKGICKQDGRCKCWKAKQPCTSHCHLKMGRGVEKHCKYC